jgi:hypothetical protein
MTGPGRPVTVMTLSRLSAGGALSPGLSRASAAPRRLLTGSHNSARPARVDTAPAADSDVSESLTIITTQPFTELPGSAAALVSESSEFGLSA